MTSSSSGYDDLVTTLREAQLAVPPIPASLRSGLQHLGPWAWSTRPIDPGDMYFFERYPQESVASQVPDYVAVSHAGHGANSYGLNYHLVYGPLAVFTQNLWGGAYTDPGETRQAVEKTFQLVAELVAIVEAAPATKEPCDRLVVAYSDFRSVSWRQIQLPTSDGGVPSVRDLEGRGTMELDVLRTESSAALRRVLGLRDRGEQK